MNRTNARQEYDRLLSHLWRFGDLESKESLIVAKALRNANNEIEKSLPEASFKNSDFRPGYLRRGWNLFVIAVIFFVLISVSFGILGRLFVA